MQPRTYKTNNRIYAFLTAVMTILLIAAVVFGALVSDVYAESSDDGGSQQVVRIGYYESRAFQEGAADGAAKSGYGYEYLQRIASYADWRYEYEYGSWSDLYKKLESGKIDMLAGVAKTEGRKREVLFPNTAMLNETFYLYKQTQDETLTGSSVHEFNDKRIGVVANTNAESSLVLWLNENDCNAAAVEFKNLAEAYKSLLAGDIDAFASSDNAAHSLGDIAPLEIIGKEPYYIAVSSKRADLLSKLNEVETIVNTQDREFLDKLSTRYTADTAVNRYLTKQESDWMSKHTSLTIGYLNNYMPYCATDAAGEPTGLMVDVMLEIIDKLPGDWSPQLNYVGFDDQHDLFAALANHKVDIAFPVGGETWYAEQNGYMRSSAVTSPTVDVIYQASSSFDAATQVIAINSNNALQESYVKAYFPQAKVIYFDTIGECLKAVKGGKAGSTIVNGLRAGSLLHEESSLIALQMPENDDRCFGVAVGQGTLLQILNRGLGIIGSDFGTNASYLYTSSLYSFTIGDLVKEYWPFLLALLAVLVLIVGLWAVRHYKKLQREKQLEVDQNARLEEALEKAERASAAKDTLLTNLSHDIRTPLNGILGIMEINSTCTDQETRRINIAKARKAADQLLGIVDDLLELTKLRSGDIALENAPLNLSNLVNALANEENSSAKERGITIRCLEKPAKLNGVWIAANETYLAQVLHNVLDNAVRFSADGEEVVFETQVKNTLSKDGTVKIDVAFVVRDHGVGMSEEFLAEIFEPFSQEKSDARSVYPGSGLGMPIVKELVELMGGSISVESSHGVGTTVEIRIPFSPVVAPSKSTGSDEKTPGDISGMHILLAEDNDLNVEITKYALEQNRAHVDVAFNGVEALDLFNKSKVGAYDVILMDIMMPKMDGIAAARAIRALNRADAVFVPIIAMTANVSEEDKAKTIAAGMNEHLSKPIDVELLVSTLAAYR